jgi:hypothetical protein
LLVLLAATVPLLPQAVIGEGNHRPPFSWDNVPLYAHFGDRNGLRNDDVEFIASHYDFVVLEKAHGQATYGDTEPGTIKDVARIKAINPDAKILYYWNLLLDYPLYRASAIREDTPDWFIHHVDGGLDRKPSGEDGLRRYDLSNPDFQQWWVTTAKSMLVEGSMDGVFIDAVPQVALRPDANIKKWGAEKYEAIERGIGETLTELKREIGRDSIVIFNGIRSVPGGWDHGGMKYLDFADGAIVEHFNAFQSQQPEQIAEDIDRMIRAGKAGKIVILKAFPGLSWLDKDMMRLPQTELIELAKQRIEFPLAAFLIVAEEHSYFNYTWGYRAQHGAYAWYPEYDHRLGPPKGDAVRNGAEYRREFEYASVYLNIESKQAEIIWQ